MKLLFVYLILFVVCELVGAWQGWAHLMIVGGGWLVMSILQAFSESSKKEVKNESSKDL